MQHFPNTRLRRSRQTNWSRRLVAENHLRISDLVWPVFVAEDADAGPIDALPDVSRLSIAELVHQARHAWTLGIPAIAIFPVTPTALKCDEGREALNEDNLVCRAVRAVKDAVPDLGIITDVALDPYTSHGQDGVLRDAGRVHNDETVELLCEQALLQVRAGCDIVAPSDMMDGRVGAIRSALEQHGFADTLILSYAVKYASAFYGPFREAVGSAGALRGDKKTYQMGAANAKEALREVELDIAEGADMVMVKPGMPYLDIIRSVSDRFDVPVFAYQVSGEYAMLKHASAAGAFDEEAAILESLLAFKRAGATAIFTYAAPQVAEWIGR
jgi:porphobilinogen synthase